MSFFENYIPKQEKTFKKEELKPEQPKPKMNPFRVLIDGDGLIKQVADNPEIPNSKVDIGEGMSRQWQPLNYNPGTGVIEEWK